MQKEQDQQNCVYMVACADGTLYTGWTNDVQSRVRAHNAGKGAKYTRSRLPVKLVYCEVLETKNEALARERALKALSRSQKMQLIEKNPVDL